MKIQTKPTPLLLTGIYTYVLLCTFRQHGQGAYAGGFVLANKALELGFNSLFETEFLQKIDYSKVVYIFSCKLKQTRG